MPTSSKAHAEPTSNPITASSENRASLDRIRKLTVAMEAAKQPRYIVDVAYAWSVMIATARRLHPQRAVFKALPGFDGSYVDRYEDLANALVCNQALLATASSNGADIFALGVALMKRRTSLLLACDALADQGLLDADVVAKIRGGAGYNDLLEDIAALNALFATHAKTIAHKHPITNDFLDATATAAREFALVMADREQRDVTVRALQDERACLVSLAVEANRQVRRASAFLELDRTGEPEFAPSIFAGNNGRSASAPVIAPAPTPPVTPVTPVTPAPVPVPAPAKPQRDAEDDPFKR